MYAPSSRWRKNCWALDRIDPPREPVRVIVAIYAGEARLLGKDADAAVQLMKNAIDRAWRRTGVPWRYRARLIVLTEFVAAYRAIVARATVLPHQV